MNIEIQSGGTWQDITNLIAIGGVKWSRNDIDGPSAGRTITGTMERDRVATKMKMEITCVLLSEDELQTLLQLIAPEYVYVRYDDPQLGQRSVWMYANNNSATSSHYDVHLDMWWKEVTFPLIEV